MHSVQSLGVVSPNYQSISESRPWRWSVGRISCALRVPVYAIFATLLAVKIGFKILANVVTLGQISRSNKPGRIWSKEGIARDAITLLDKLQRAVNSVWSAVWAPPKSYRSFGEATKKSIRDLFDGRHLVNDSEITVSVLWESFKASIPKYHKQMIQCDCISNEIFKTLLAKHPNYKGPIPTAG